MPTVLQLSRRLDARPEVPVRADVQVRHYRDAADITAWLNLRQSAFAGEKLAVRPWSDADFRSEIVAKPWWRPERMWLVELAGPESAGLVVGAITMAQRGSGAAARPVIHWLMVDPEHRRRGLGRLLVAALEQAAWDSGWHEIRLETHSAWIAALRFYEKLGYRVVDGTSQK